MTVSPIDKAIDVLNSAVEADNLDAATIYFRHKASITCERFGQAESMDSVFLIASISKPVCVAALLTLFDDGEFQLDDPVSRFIPELEGDGRDAILMEHLFTHRSGLPDQLAENLRLRQEQSELSCFVDFAVRAPLAFTPGTRYQYSSMGILLAMEVAQRITGVPMQRWMRQVFFQPMGMFRTALGLGSLPLQETMPCQRRNAAPESGGGNPESTSWDWNSDYWRRLGAPWGGVHSSALDVARFMNQFLDPSASMLSSDAIELMTKKRHGSGAEARSLGFAIGVHAGSSPCSSRTFGHEGATGTLVWADPEYDAVCVILTTLPENAATPHPRDVASAYFAQAMTS